MRLRECVVGLSGQSCIETTELALVLLPYIVGRCLELVLRDMAAKLDDIPDVEPHLIDFT